MRERDLDAFLVQRLLDELGHRVQHVEVVLAFAEGPHQEIHRTVVQRLDLDEGRRVFEDVGVVGEHRVDHRAHGIGVFLVGHAEVHIHTPHRVMRVVDDLIAPDLAVGDDDLLLVEGLQHGGEQVDLLDIAEAVGGVDEIAHLVGPEHQQHHPRRHIGQRALQRQAYRQAGGTQQGNDRCRLHAKAVEHGNDHEGQHDVLGHTAQKLEQGVVELFVLLPGLADQPIDLAR